MREPRQAGGGWRCSWMTPGLKGKVERKHLVAASRRNSTPPLFSSAINNNCNPNLTKVDFELPARRTVQWASCRGRPSRKPPALQAHPRAARAAVLADAAAVVVVVHRRWPTRASFSLTPAPTAATPQGSCSTFCGRHSRAFFSLRERADRTASRLISAQSTPRYGRPSHNYLVVREKFRSH
jgi:hypothetical protein